ncbi:MAG TPA: 6-carboxytetrahydropterin synthase [Terriglobia bacterium]|nr:6-carboxytetrahydropterin synthase [Terriglobia bacterium]
MKVGIVEHIDCAHFLPGHSKCGTLHGHTYKIEIVVEGPVKDGMVIDFSDLKTVVREILATYDHRSWNDTLDYPSVENICALLHERFRERLTFRYSLKVWEGDGKWAEL